MVDGTNYLPRWHIDEMESDNLSPSHVLPIAIRQMTREEDLTARIVASLLLGINVLKLHQHRIIVFETILLHIERYENAINVEHQVLGIHSVEDIISNGKGNLSLHTMRLAQLTYFIYVVTSYHNSSLFILHFLSPPHELSWLPSH